MNPLGFEQGSDFTARLRQLDERDSDLSPVQAFDTAISLGQDGTVVTTLVNLEELNARLITRPEDDWQRLFEESDEDTPENRLTAEYIAGGIATICLVKEAVRQQLTNRPNSGRIMVHERELYGDMYTDALFAASLARQIKFFSWLNPNIAPQAAVVRDRLVGSLKQIADNGPSVEVYEGPNLDVLQKTKEWFMKNPRYEPTLELVSDDKALYDATEVRNILGQALMQDPLFIELGWQSVLKDLKKPAVMVMSGAHEVIVPSTCTPKDPSTLRALIVHEIFGHAGRSADAEAMGFQLGTTGTPTYSGFEESLCIALAQCMLGEYQPLRGIGLYAGISLAINAMGSTLDRKGVFEFEKMYDHVYEAIQNGRDLTAEELAESESSALYMMQRIYRGMHTEAEGVAHMSDLKYFSNLEEAWRLIDWIVTNGCMDEAMPWLLCAKFNPLNITDLELVSTYKQPPEALRQYLHERITERAA